MHLFVQGSIPNMNNIVDLSTCITPETHKAHSFVDKIHGLTDKLQALSHLGHDSIESSRGKSGTITHLSYYFYVFFFVTYLFSVIFNIREAKQKKTRKLLNHGWEF